MSRTTSIPQIMQSATAGGPGAFNPVFITLFLSLIIVILAETARIPVDDPSTHLELTMVHEAMLLEYSGRHLALMEYGAAIRQLTFITLLANLLLPTDWLFPAAVFGIAGSAVLCLLVFLIKAALLTLLIGAIEVFTVKVRLFTIPNLAALAFLLSFIAFSAILRTGGSVCLSFSTRFPC